ncbi:SCO7613 C-terminal domain-containing membrane protein [Streptomyces sp. NPDC058045]|uniref:SCO7613 C-terminal domain-containing membrane protein n=1 Tax=Streptomyces sp. NPDC058045 TaxID=3346311 RepID=UPI0036E34D4C
MTFSPPPFASPAEELRVLDAELAQLDARRAQLLTRRAWLVQLLGTPARVPAPVWQAPRPAPAGAEVSGPGAQRVLLVLGGVLLAVAAVAFTVVGWGAMGIGGRSAVLAVVTLATAAAPVLLLRRALRSTAEVLAALALALTVLDAYAVHRVLLPDTGGLAFTAVASAVLAAAWAGYGLSLPTLRLPGPAAVAVAQLPLFLGALAVDAGPVPTTAALLLTAAGDALALLIAGRRAVRLAAASALCTVGGLALLSALWLTWTSTTLPQSLQAALLLALTAALCLTLAHRLPAPTGPAEKGVDGTTPGAVVAATLAGTALVAGVAGVVRVPAPESWTWPLLLCTAALLLPAATATTLPTAIRRGLAAASLGLQALAVLSAVPLVAAVLLGPVSWLPRIWSGAPDDARAVTGAVWEAGAGHPVAADLVLLLAAATATVLARSAAAPPRYRSGARWTAAALGLCGLLAAPAALRLPYPTALALPLLLTAALLTLAHRTPAPAPQPPASGQGAPASRPARNSQATAGLAATATALLCATEALGAALPSRPATLLVLAVLTALFTATAASTRPETAHGPGRAAAAAAVLCATALAGTGGAALDLAPHRTALLVLLVPAAAVLIAALLATRLAGRPAAALRQTVELAAVPAALTAPVLAIGHPATLSAVLAGCAVLAAATAIRPDRRPAGPAAAVLFFAATWVRLAAWGVTLPEAYTGPVTVAGLAVGLLRRRQDRTVSSWTAYGAPLTATLVPSLVQVWASPHGPRPLLLGTAALLATLAGARARLQAPLVLGGTALGLVAVHELAPYVLRLVGVLPRWVLPALAGLLLLAVGATYERRLREARRVRDALGRMG